MSRWLGKGLIRTAWCLGALAILVIADRALARHYYGRTYRYYEAGEVYWEDSNTLLLFSPDRYLFWRLKPSIVLHLVETPAQYGLKIVGSRPAPYEFTVRTNSRGYNSPEFACGESSGRLRIVTLGDSRTMAEGVPFELVYARRLEVLLAPDRPAEVVNAGVSGYSLHQGLVQLEHELLACRPDVVTVLFGINDQDTDQGLSDVEKGVIFDSPIVTLRQALNRSMVYYFLQQQAGRLRGWLLGKTPVAAARLGNPSTPTRRVSLAEYERGLDRVVDLSVTHHFRPVFLVLPTSSYAYEPSLFEDEPAPMPDRAVAALDEARTRLEAADPSAAAAILSRTLAEFPRFSEARFTLARCHQLRGKYQDAHREFVAILQQTIFARYADVVRRVAARRSVTLVDLTPDFTAASPDPLYVDDMHPNAAGHEIIARRLRDALVARPGP